MSQPDRSSSHSRPFARGPIARGPRPFGGGLLGRGRFVLALIVALMALISFLISRQENPITGERPFAQPVDSAESER